MDKTSKLHKDEIRAEKIKVFKTSIIQRMKSLKNTLSVVNYRSGKIDGMKYISIVVSQM